MKAMGESVTPPPLYRARGQAHETLGEFEQAQHDYTDALDAARTMNDRVAEWQSAIDLGFLWAGRDYVQAETSFRQALVLAKSLNDPTLHARSLNRIGNWHLNVEVDNRKGQSHERNRHFEVWTTDSPSDHQWLPRNRVGNSRRMWRLVSQGYHRSPCFL